MASSPPPLPPSPSLDDLRIPPFPHSAYMPTEPCILIPDDTSLDIFPPIDPLSYVPPPSPPIDFFFPGSLDNKCYTRGRSRSRSCSHSRSRSPSPARRRRSVSPSGRYSPIRPGGPIIYVNAPPILPSRYDTDSSPSRRSRSPVSSRSPSPRPRRRRYSYRSRTPSPIPYIYPPPVVPVPSMTPPAPIPPIMWQPPSPISDPVDILTFSCGGSMAYAPAAKTYDEAIDNVLELWPCLDEFGRDRIHLFVGGADQIVRVPKMAWQLVMCDLPRYEIVHVQVEQPPPPPQYQSDGKGTWASGDEKKENKKQARSGGFFSSIKRIFGR